MVIKTVVFLKIEDSIRKGFEEFVTRSEAIRLLRAALQ